VELFPIDALEPELRQRWAAARVWAAHQAPYLATALLALIPVVVEQKDGPGRFDLSGFPADKRWHLYLDPAVLSETDVPTLGFWLLHQATHLLRHHPGRYPGETPTVQAGVIAPRSVDQRRWNVSCDAEINDDLCAGHVTVPATAITPGRLEAPDGQLAEQYWDLLNGVADIVDNGDDCGSGCDGQRRPWDSKGPGLGEIDCQLLGRDVARRIREHSRQQGEMPAGWQRWADEILEPTVNWRRVLAGAVRNGVASVAGRVDFTYRRPSRRASSVKDVILPSLRQPLPSVAIVIDTSGSMSDQMLAQALGEVGGVLRSVGVGRRNLRVICCDAEAYEAQRLLDAGQVRLLGGGGTDMGAGLGAAAELKPRPDLVVVLTDGHTPWPHHPPRGVRVVVGLMDPAGSVPDWATGVTIEPDGVAAGW
jgi:hypothetical protein